MADCIQTFQELLEAAYGEKEGRRLLLDIKDLDDSLIGEIDEKVMQVLGDVDLLTADSHLYRKATHDIMDYVRQQIDTSFRQRIMNKQKLGKLREYMKQFPNQYNAILNVLTGTAVNVQGGRFSVDAASQSYLRQSMGSFIDNMETHNLTKFFNDEATMKLAYKELSQFSERNLSPKSITGNKQAHLIAHHMFEAQRILILEARRQGVNIPMEMGHITRQVWDRDKINTSRDEFLNDLRQHADFDRMFKNLSEEQIQIKLDKIFQTLATGADESDAATGGTLNVGRKMLKERVIHMRSDDQGEAWMYMMDKWGRGQDKMRDVFMSELQNTANYIGQIHLLGTNPERMIRELKDHATNNAEKEMRELAGKTDDDSLKRKEQLEQVRRSLSKGRIESTWRTVNHAISYPEKPWLNDWGQGVRTLNNLRLLGKVLMSAFGDVGVRIMTEHFIAGRGYWSSMGRAVRDSFNMLGKSEEKMAFARSLGIGVETQLGMLASRFDFADPMSGKTARVNNTFFKLVGQTRWNDVNKAGAVASYADALHHGLTGKMNDRMVRSLRKYGFDETDIELMRKVTGKLTPAGATARTSPLDLDLLDIDTLPGNTREARERYLSELRTKMFAMYDDFANTAVLTPSAKERAAVTFGTDAGTGRGEAIRLLTQFKPFPITMMSKTIRNMTLGEVDYVPFDEGFADVVKTMGNTTVLQNMSQLVTTTTMFGYLSLAAKDIADGKEPRDLNQESLIDAFIQGGSAAIYGDILHNYSRTGDVSRTVGGIAGPTVGAVADLTKVVKSNSWEEALVNSRVLTPGQNVWWAKYALDQAIYNDLVEMSNPGKYHRQLIRNEEMGRNDLFQ